MNKELIKRAIVLFPRTEYTSPEAVRHARRQWLRCIAHLRSQSPSAWVADTLVRIV